MTYGNMPLIIPILATGYLLSVYVLLILARNVNEPRKETLSASKTLQQQPVTPKVSEASSVRS